MANNDQTSPTTDTVVAPLDALFDDAPAAPAADAPVVDVAPLADAALIVPADEQAIEPATATDAALDMGPHPTIAKRIVFDGNTFDIPRGTPDVILSDNNVLRRAYATAMARPELTQAQMEDGTTVIDGHSVPTLTLRVRPQVKGAPQGAPSITDVLARVPAVPLGTANVDDRMVRRVLRGGSVTFGQAVRHKLGEQFDNAANPRTSQHYGGANLCRLLDTLPSDADAVAADAVSFVTRR